MRKVRGVTFDCWGTLITDHDFSAALAARRDALSEIGGIDPERAAELVDRGWRVHHRAWLDGTQYGSAGIAAFCASELGLNDPDIVGRLQTEFEEAGRLGRQAALDGAVETLRTLRRAGLRTALVCDAGFTPGRIVRDFLDEAGLLPHLEFCAFSNEVGEPKPNPSIFRTALEAIDTHPDEAVHVGDLLRTDIFGARRLGMGTVRITAIDDDAARGFSWDPDAALSADPRPGPSEKPSGAAYPEADAVVASHAELGGALRRLGAELG